MSGSDFKPLQLYAAEVVGTFALVLAGCGAAVVNEVHADVLGHFGVALAFSLAVMVVIHSLGDVSGAHINPAVTLGFAAAGRFPKRRVLPYIASQCIGALAAAGLLLWWFPGSPASLGATLPTVSTFAAFSMEVLLTGFLMFVILSVSIGAKEKGITAGITIGAVVLLVALVFGPLTGGSMNPARSLGPAIVSGNLESLWIYLAAPVTGALLAVPLCCLLREERCCTAPES